jgi:hypothetical protein
MTLIVEDGTGKDNAESYISVVDADTYHSNRGNTDWAALTTAEKERLLRIATDYMVAVYRLRWDGYRYVNTQALDWPRIYVPIRDICSVNAYPEYVDFDVVPNQVKNACADLALKANSETLLEDQSQQTIREKVGPIEVEYDKFSPQFKRYLQVENSLSIYFASSANQVKLMRT